jgi:aspartyl-tRNA(Asn)/glutamyl-tRNA(Gln) amidotransferase subunit A
VLSGGYYDAYYRRAQQVRTLIRRDFAEAFAHCDVLLAPVAPTPAFRAGQMSSPLEMYLSDIYTLSANLAGVPGISVPWALSASGLPIGVQVLGPALGEVAILCTAALLEQATGGTRFPDL